MTQKFHEPFSPAIMETEVPMRFVDIVNKVSDEILSDEEKSAKWDFSHKLVGKVHKEIQIPVTDKKDREFLFNIMKNGCVEYLKYSIEKNRARTWKWATPTENDIQLTHSWVVSQYAGDFNPFHHHSGDFSATIYLKIPEGMNNEIAEDMEDHYPAKGMIEFGFGESQPYRSDNLKFKPEVGKFMLFPSWLKHFVYPFSCEGERRMMSFNATIKPRDVL
tara:strand:+ start:191 stop:847 length:657 start_codon:yes stop_codon:yes gene_type:complete